MKMYIARDDSGLLCVHREEPILINRVWDSNDWWTIDCDLFPSVTFENSPQEVELKVKHNGMRLSPMFRLLDMIVIKDPSDRKRIVAYTKKLIDKLKEEGFDADARVAEGYLKMFNGESMAMATMDEVELKLKK